MPKARTAADIVEPPGGWADWNSESEDGRFLATLLQGEATRSWTALQIQLQYETFLKYKPANFSKSVQRMREKLGLRSPRALAAAHAAAAVAASATNSNSLLPAPCTPGGIPLGGISTGGFSTLGATEEDAMIDEMFAWGSSNPPIVDGGPQIIWMPTFIEEFHDGLYRHLGVRIQNLSGVIPIYDVDGANQKLLTVRYFASKNATDPAYSFSKFTDARGNTLYPEQHVRTVAFHRVVNSMLCKTGDLMGKVLFQQNVHLSFPCDLRPHSENGIPGIKHVKYARTGEVWTHINLIEAGARAKMRNSSRSVGGPPASISVVSGMGADTAMDDGTTGGVSVWSSPSADYRTVNSRRTTTRATGSVAFSVPTGMASASLAAQVAAVAASRLPSGVAPPAVFTPYGSKRQRNNADGTSNVDDDDDGPADMETVEEEVDEDL